MSLAVKAARGTARGDPGFLGDIGKFIGGAVSTIGGLVPGVGGIAKAAGGLITKISGGGAPQRLPVKRGGVSVIKQIGQRTRPQIFGGGFVGAQENGRTAKQEATARAAGLACPKGHKPNESSYFLKDGTFVLAGTKCVRIRRRNPLNPRAADRAISRLESSKKAVTKINRFTIRKKKCPN